jgi:tricorn protease
MRNIILSLCLLIVLISAPLAFAEGGTKLLRFPDYADGKIVFVYQNDLWVVPETGGLAQRLTVFDGVEDTPKISPDGKLIAFNGQYRGNTNVFVIPISGGEPLQLTYHPEDGTVIDWKPDGKHVLFTSGRDSPVRFYRRFFEVALDGSAPFELPVDQAGWASYSPDGTKLALNRHSYSYWWWKRYKGSANTDIWVMDLKTGDFQQLTDWEGQDSWPMWAADGKIYFVSERDGIANIYSIDPDTRDTLKITDHKIDGVQWPSLGSDGRKIVYECDGGIWLLDLTTRQTSEVEITANVDPDRPMVEWINPFDNYFVDASISPSGKRVLVEARGEVFSLPVENGETRNLTESSGARDREPAWSPDGKQIAYISDLGGEFEIYLIDQMGKEQTQKLTDTGGFKFGVTWSPDSKKLLYYTNKHNLMMIDLAAEGVGREPKKIAGSSYGDIRDYDWSPDSKWIAFVEPLRNDYSVVKLYSLAKGEATQVSAGDATESNVAFDPDGIRLYWLSRGRAWGGFAYNASPQRVVMSVSLAEEKEEPFLKAEDEEPETVAAKEEKPGKESAGGAAKPTETKTEETKISLDGISKRIRIVPIRPGDYSSLDLTSSNIYFLEREPGSGFRQGAKLQAWNLKTQETTTILPSVVSYHLSAKGDKVLYYDGKNLAVVGSAGPAKPNEGRIDTSGMRMRLDRRAEWKQMYEESWRMVRDFFYDENHHGVDWNAVGDFYRSLLPYVTTREELSLLLSELVGELNASHQGARGTPDIEAVPSVNVAQLGAVLEPDLNSGWWRFKTIYHGDKTDRRYRAPLFADYVTIKEGDYLLKIDGREIHAGEDYLKYLVGRDNGYILLTTNSKPELAGAVETRIQPLTSEAPLRYKSWIDSNREKVERLGGGKIGYVHLPDMVFDGLVEFNKAFTEFRYCDALILDCRFNGGGGIDPILIDMLERRAYQVTRTRDYAPEMRPSDGFYGHVVVLINEYSYSDAEVFPSAFTVRKLGTVIGVPTLGFVIAVGPYDLIDNGVVRRTTTGLWDVQGNQLESRGAIPDIIVKNPPKETYNGGDAQLEAAVNYLLKLIAEQPVPRPEDYKQEIKPR